jgi:phosphate starvation-inducible PhoH-like protein
VARIVTAYEAWEEADQKRRDQQAEERKRDALAAQHSAQENS